MGGRQGVIGTCVLQKSANKTALSLGFWSEFFLTPSGASVIIYMTYAMRRPPKLPPDAKTQALREAGALHPHPEAVRDDAFLSHPFFDPRDRVQVKYEMVRRHRVDGRPVTEVAARFGVSRQTFYQTAAAFEAHGIPGLVPKRPGPKRAHKCTDAVRGRRGGGPALIERCAALRPGEIIDPTASVKHSLRALAARWRTLAAEIGDHDEALDTLTRRAAPTLREVFGIGPDSAAEMMIVAGDNPTRIRSDAAFAKLCGACPIPASSGVTNRHRLFRGGHRQANAALYRIVIVRMRWHQPTIDYVRRRTAEGLSKKDIIRCLKRFVAREVYHALIDDHRSGAACAEAA